MAYGHQAQFETWVHIPWGAAYWASETHMQSKHAEQSALGLGCSGGAPSVVTRMVRACCVAAVRPCGLRRVMTVAQLAAPPPPPGSACTPVHSSPLMTTRTHQSTYVALHHRTPACSISTQHLISRRARWRCATLQRRRHTVPGMGVGSTVPPTSGVASDRCRGSAAWSSSTGDPAASRASVGHFIFVILCSDGRRQHELGV
jgi:hypothetical protein